MEYSPPPLFKQGAPARVKVTVFALLSVALLMIDSRVHSLAPLRQVVGTTLYPFQMVALMPRDLSGRVSEYFSTLSSLERELAELRRQQVLMARTAQQSQFYMAENAQLRKLMDARQQVPGKSMMGEILYDARDASTRKVVIDRGTRQGVQLGLPIIDNQGVVGQVTRVFPFTSEVTLLTDKDQAIPVQVLRNGLRSVAIGQGQSGLLDLRFMAPNADIQVGDILITSGIDGVYPAGLAVAKVVQVENTSTGAFGRVVCQPLAGIDRNRQLLILMDLPEMPERPADEDSHTTGGKKRALPKMGPIKEPGSEGVNAAALAPGAVPAAGAPAGAVPGTATPAATPLRPQMPVPVAPQPAAAPATSPAAPATNNGAPPTNGAATPATNGSAANAAGGTRATGAAVNAPAGARATAPAAQAANPATRQSAAAPTQTGANAPAAAPGVAAQAKPKDNLR